MTPRELIEAFGTLAEAPDGVKRLRELVLQLAVRGKLVPQVEGEEPAGRLLERIAAAKAQQVKDGKVRANKLEEHVDFDTAPFDIPHSWIWTRSAVIGWVNPRNKVADTAEVGFVPMPLVPIDYREPVRWETRRWAEVKNGFTHFAEGDVAVAKITPCFQNRKSCVMKDLPNGIGAGTTELHVLRPLPDTLDARYMLGFYKTPDFIGGGVATMTGTAGQQRVSNDYFSNCPVPLPPLAEQHRIVAKVDELMAFLDKLEAAKTARDTTRKALRDAALAALREADSPDDVELAWGRIAEQMDELFAEPEDVAPLRQAVLQLAVRGRLVRQVEGDEPAGRLLERIGKDRALSGRLRKADSVLRSSEATGGGFALPAGWAWGAAEGLTQPGRGITYGIIKPVWVSNGTLTVRVTEMKTGTIDIASLPQCLSERAAKFGKATLASGDLLISKDGTIGKTAFVPPELAGGNITQHVLRFGIHGFLNRHFVKVAIDSPMCQTWMTGETKGVALQGVNVGDFQRMPIPVPPLAEQHRIVAKVDEFMALLDALESRLRESKRLQAAFAAAAVHHLHLAEN